MPKTHLAPRSAFPLIAIVCALSLSSTQSQARIISRGPQPAKVALVHMAPVLGDLDANLAKIDSLVGQAIANGANIVITPELATTGYSITAKEVKDKIGISAPFSRFATLRRLAAQHGAYVVVGVAEKSAAGTLFNSAVTFGPHGLENLERKRGVAGWNARGDTAFRTIPSRFGSLGVVICSDSYLADWVRILRLQRARIVLMPANWWGGGQEQIWRTRARENGVWVVVANRWGHETDTRYGKPYDYDMNDAPSEVIDPAGRTVLVFDEKRVSTPRDKILYYTIPSASVMGPMPPLSNRKPQAYMEIGNRFYRPDEGNKPIPNLPRAGAECARGVAFNPTEAVQQNVAYIQTALRANSCKMVVLPGHALGEGAMDPRNPNPESQRLQHLVDQQSLDILVTSGRIPRVGNALFLFRSGALPEVVPYVHTSNHALSQPPIINVPHARVAVVSEEDSLYPEVLTALGKEGADIVLIPSDIRRLPMMNQQAATDAWETAVDNGYDVLAVDASGFGEGITANGGFLVSKQVFTVGKDGTFMFDTTTVRAKHLNAYNSFDLKALLGSVQ